jgi:type IV pilus assembly protein PilO
MASYLDKIQKIPPKTRLIALIVVIVLLVSGYIVQFQIPMKTQKTTLETSLSETQAKIRENDNKIKKLDDLRSEVKSLEQRLVVLTEQLPPESEVSGLLRQIQNLVNQSGLVLKLWKPDKRRPHSSGLYEEIPITLVLTGGYHNTASFFDRVGKLTRIVNILNIKMGNAKMAPNGSMVIEINCQAMTFAAVEKKVDAGQATKKTK